MGAELLIARGPPHDQKTAATALALGMSGPLVSAVESTRSFITSSEPSQWSTKRY
jgi:hypothetical protein